MSQKEILRVITFNDKNAPSIPIFDSLKVLKFNDMITMHIVSFVYECVHNLSPTYFSNFFIWIENVHSFGTRQLKKAICLLFVAIQLIMDFDLSITQVFGFGILFQLTYEIWSLSPFFVLKLNLIFYQIIAQFDTYICMYIVHRILINALIYCVIYM